MAMQQQASVVQIAPQRILILHPHRLVAEALAQRLESEGFDVRTMAPRADDKLGMRLRFFAPDLVVAAIDTTYASKSSDIRMMLSEGNLLTLVIVDPDDTRTAIRAIDDGAVGFMSTDQTLDSLSDAVRLALRGDPIHNPRDLDVLRQRQNREDNERRDRLSQLMSLSPREGQILADLVGGNTVDFIAQARGISTSTVRTHVKRVLKKLTVSSQLEAVAAANRAGWRGPRSSD